MPLELDIPKIPGEGIEFQGKIGKTKYISKDESIKVHVYSPVVDQEVGVTAKVGFMSSANSSAHADFDFNEDKKTPIEFDEGSVWYYAPD